MRRTLVAAANKKLTEPIKYLIYKPAIIDKWFSVA